MSRLNRVLISLAIAGGVAAPALAQQAVGQAPAIPTPLDERCAALGTSGVLVNGRPMLTLSDVAACPGLRYEIIPGVLINGEPAIRLTPDADCAPTGSEGVLIDGAPAATAGQGCVR